MCGGLCLAGASGSGGKRTTSVTLPLGLEGVEKVTLGPVFQDPVCFIVHVIGIIFKSLMEADWGTSCFDGDDDFVQSYANFSVTGVVDLEDDCDDDEVSEDDSTTLVSGRKGVLPKRKATKSRHATVVGARKKRKRKKTGAEYYYEMVLRWMPRLLTERRRLNLAPLNKPDMVYATAQYYYQALQTLPLEESRVSLLRGMEAPSDVFHASVDAAEDFLLLSSFGNITGLCSIDFTLDRVASDRVKPGWVYFFCPSEGGVANGATPAHRKSSLANQLREEMNRWGDSCLLASLCLSAGSMRHYAGNVQSFWVHNAALAGMNPCHKSPATFPQHWKVYAIENLISYQRMIAACFERPKPSFLSGLLGHKKPVHIKFDSDGEEGSGAVSLGREADNELPMPSSGATDSSSESDSSFESGDEGGERADLLTPLDSSQEVAMSGILGVDGCALTGRGGLHLVQGPPGCGKTFFLVHMLHRIVAQCPWGFRVLVCGPSNKAVCVAVERFRSSSLPGSWKKYPVVLVGVQEKIDNCSAPTQSNSGEVIWGRSRVSDGDMNAATSAPAAIREEIHSLWLQFQSCNSHVGSSCMQNTAQRKTGSRHRKSHSSESCLEHRTEISTDAGVERSGGEQPCGILPPTLIRLVSSVSDPVTAPDVLIYTYSRRVGEALRCLSVAVDCCIEAHLCIVSSPQHPLGLPMEPFLAQKRDSLCTTCLRGFLAASVNCIANEYHSVIDTLTCVAPYFVKQQLDCYHIVVIQCLQDIQALLAASTDRADNATADVREPGEVREKLKTTLDDMSGQFFEPYWDNDLTGEVMRSAVVVCSTLSSSGCSAMRSIYATRGFDILLVDEAGQCLESELMIPLVYNPKQLILVGDPRQLPATVLSVEAQRLGLGVSTMQRLMYHCNAPFHMLSTQYRMHPAICKFPNERFYNGQLSTDDSVHVRPNLLQEIVGYCPQSRRSFEWMDAYTFVDISHEESGGGFGGKSKANAGEASLIAQIVRSLGKLQGTSIYSQIGIITFYAAQVSMIKRKLHEHGVPHNSSVDDSAGGQHAVRVMSVDGYQGSEADIIFISSVRCNSASKVGFVEDFQRLNVSLTRAKHALILVGCASTLESSESVDLQQLISDARCRDRIVESRIVLEKLSHIM